MRKIGLALFTSMALVAFMGLSATAFGLADPRCEEAGNPFEMLDFDIDTPDTIGAHLISSVDGSGYACGSDIRPLGQGHDTLNNHADIGVPPGVEIADSDSVPVGSYAAFSKVNVLYHAFALAFFDDGPDGTGLPSDVVTDDKSACQRELDEEIVGPTPGSEPGSQIVACLHGTNLLGENWNWSVRDADGKLWTTIGPMHGIAGVEPGLTYVNLSLCAYYGDVGSTECGTAEAGDQWQQRNGDDSFKSCPGGRGLYSVTATNEAGETTAPATSCVPWRSLTSKYRPYVAEYQPFKKARP